MSAADEGRTEKGTAKKREKERQEGTVAKSNELNALFSLMAGFLALSFLGGYMINAMGEMMVHTFTEMGNLDTSGHIITVAHFYTERFLFIMLPTFLVIFFAVAIINVVQVGFQVTWKAIMPKFGKVNPFANFKKVLISKQSMVELLKTVLKIGVLSFLAYKATQSLWLEFTLMNQFTPVQISMKIWEYVQSVWIFVIAFALALGVGDYIWQRHQYEEKMKMKPSEVQDEQKQMQGDPQVKREQRMRGMQMLQKLMAQQTKEADVVITNPTHFAIAIMYKHGQMNAPKVVAKGMDHQALKIKKIAREAQIPIVENRGLARALYHSTDIDSEIPEKLFRPVAEILAFIFKLGKKRAGAHG